MNKIAVISMVKNEADIIESFVRHTLTFADVMLVAEHRSTDATPKILEKLQAEGLPLQVMEISAVEQVQSEVLTQLMMRAAVQEKADIILPLDADEFLVTDRAENCRQQLQRLDSRKIFSLDWVRYVLAEPEIGQSEFLLSRNCLRERAPEVLKKVIVGSQVLEQAALFLTQGSHAMAYRDSQELMAIETQPVVGMHLAHFPWRGQEQASSKEACGWLTNVAKYSVHTNMANHWHRSFQCLQRGECLRPAPLKMPVKGEPWTGPVPRMQYTAPGSASLLRNLLSLGEQLAEAYREESILRRQRVVSILLPFWGDMPALEKSLESVYAQTYPYKEVFVLAMENVDCSSLRGPLQRRYQETQILEGTEEMICGRLQQAAAGEYVQWVFPGEVLHPEKIKTMVVTLETQENITFLLAQAGSSEADTAMQTWPVLSFDFGDEDFVPGEGQALWQIMLQNGMLLPGGLTAALFRRTTMEKCQWFRYGLFGENPLMFSMWGNVLPHSTIGALNEVLVTEAAGESAARDWVWHQIEWACLLQNYARQPEIFSQEQYRKTLGIFRRRNRILQARKSEIDVLLWQQYESAVKLVAQTIP